MTPPLPLGILAAARAVIASGWTPADLAGVVGWYDASDLATLTHSAGAVSSWAPKVGSFALMQSGAGKPTTGIRTIGGRNALDFNNDSLSSGAMSNAQPVTIYLVAQADVTTGEQVAASAATPGLYVPYITGATWWAYAGLLLSTGVAADTKPHVFGFTYDGAASKFRLDGSQIAAGNAGALTQTRLTVGGSNVGAGGLWDGAVGEFLAVAGTLSPEDIANIEGYLMGKWGFVFPAASLYPSWGTAAPAPLAATYVTNRMEANPSAATTFAAVPIGVAAADRFVILAVGCSGGGFTALNGVTIGGVATTFDAYFYQSNSAMAFARLAVPAGTTAAIVVSTTGGAPSRISLGVWNINGGVPGVIDTESALYTDTAPHSHTLAALDGGVAFSHTHGGAADMTWTGATERYDVAGEAGYSGSDSATSEPSHVVTAQKAGVATWRMQSIAYVPLSTFPGFN